MANQVWALVKPRARTNYLLDPSFEGMVGTTFLAGSNWVAGGSGTTLPTVDLNIVKYGLKSVKVVGYKFIYQAVSGLTAGSVYRLSAWIYQASGAGMLTGSDNGFGNQISTPFVIANAGQWVRYEVDYTCPANGIIQILIQATNTGDTLYVDGCQIELKDDGNLCLYGFLDNWSAGLPLNWTAAIPADVTQSASYCPASYTGGSSAKVTGNGSSLVSPTIYAKPGTVLTVSFWSIVAGTAVTVVTPIGATSLAATGGAWQQVTLQFTLYISSFTLQFYVNDGLSSIYVDNVVVTAPGWYSGQATTYIDGDMSEDGGSWSGGIANRYLSTSLASANNRHGGAIYNLDAFNTAVVGFDGFGYPPVAVIDAAYANNDGGQYQTSQLNARDISLDLFIDGKSSRDVEHQREGIKECIKLDLTTTRQECTVMFYGYPDAVSGAQMPPKVIRGAYVDGLKGTVAQGDNGFFDQTKLKFKCDDPNFYGVGNNAVALYATQSLTASYIFGKINGSWTTLNGGCSATVNKIVSDNTGSLYIATSLNTGVGNQITTGGIAKYNSATNSWSGWGTGTGTVWDIVVTSNRDVYICGDFTSINSVTANGVAVLPYATGIWQALGTGGIAGGGLTGGNIQTVRTIAWDGGDRLWFGGNFTTANQTSPVTCSGFIQYNIGSGLWSANGTGFATLMPGFYIRKILFINQNLLAIGGHLSAFNGTTVGNGCYYNPTNQTIPYLAPFSTGFLTGAGNMMIWDITVSPRNTTVWAGSFQTANGVAATNIAEFNGSNFTALGLGLDNASGSNSIVTNIYYGPDGTLYCGGQFNRFRDLGGNAVTVAGLARWNGSSWRTGELQFASNCTATAYTPFSNGTFIYGLDGSASVTALALITSVTINSTAPTYPKFIITGPCQLNTITNTTASATLDFNGYIVATGEVLTVTLSPFSKSVTTNTRPDATGQRDITYILGYSDIANWRLLPNQANIINCFVSGTVSAATSVLMYYTTTYDSGDGGA